MGGESQKPQGGAPSVTVAAQLFSVPQSGPGALLQPVLFQPSLNSSPATSQAILMPISPHNAQKGQQLLQFLKGGYAYSARHHNLQY